MAPSSQAGLLAEINRLGTRIYDAATLTEFERQVRSPYKQMVRISIEPRWARFFDFGAGRVPEFLTKLGSDGA